MALWGLSLYFLFILVKMASWIGAITLVAKQFIKRYFDYRDKQVEQSDAQRLIDYFDRNKVGSLNRSHLFELLDFRFLIFGPCFNFIIKIGGDLSRVYLSSQCPL